jgi:molybdopterin/thiamine biosynthesis adenylyltransferase
MTGDRYARQRDLIGADGQRRLQEARVFVAGMGGLGCTIALHLAAAGIGSLRFADFDLVELSNLNRQILHWERDIGREKAASAEEKLHAINPDMEIFGHSARIGDANVSELVADADLIVDAMDSYPPRYILNREARKRDIPFIHGAVQGFYGQATTIIPRRTPCLSCIIPRPPPEENVQILGTTAGIIGLIEANEVIKFLLDRGDLLTGRLAIWNGLAGTLSELPVVADPDCPVCGAVGEAEP